MIENKKCNKCLLVKELSSYPFRDKKKDILGAICKGCTKIYKIEWYLKNESLVKDKAKQRYHSKQKESKRAYSNKITTRFNYYKASAKRRNIIFALSFEEFKAFWQKDCHYCNHPIETIGLDRTDSDIGYLFDNIVSCCWFCNRAKYTGSVFSLYLNCTKIVEAFQVNPYKLISRTPSFLCKNKISLVK